jgi:hypothetical protein
MPRRSELIDEIISKTPDWRGATLARLRKIILAADPEITEDVKWRRPANPLGAAVWEHAGIVCMGGILKERVRLTLYSGASLPDPHELFNAMLVGGKARAIDLGEGDEIDERALKALVRAGVEHNLAKAKPARKKPATAPRKKSGRRS